MSDSCFETIIDDLADLVMKEDYHVSYTDSELKNEWNKLRKFKAVGCNINSTVTVGNKLIEHFFPNIYDVKNKDVSFSDCWKDKELIKKILRWNRKSHSTPYLSELKRGVYFCKGLTKTTYYRPTIMKAICDRYKVSSVLDPCSGWGGRMLGTCVDKNRRYVGFEPNKETYNNLNRLTSFLQIENSTIFNDGSENMDSHLKSDDLFDMVLTSPPYFNLEVYSDESSQSISKYDSYEKWLSEWLEVVIVKSINHLTPTGISCWNVADFGKYKMKKDVVDIHSKLGYIKTNCFSIVSSKRPTNNTDKVKSLDETMIFKRKLK
jgi:16S rRNA G966 N2-methylase RsmD